MIKRYTTPEFKEIWTLKFKYDSWLKVEKAFFYALYKEKFISKQIYKNFINAAKYDIAEIELNEKNTKHDVFAFLQSVNKSLSSTDCKRWLHYGLTSTCVVDSSLGLTLQKANLLLLEELNKFKDTLLIIAKKYKYLPTIGRTHGVHAEITSFGYKFAIWYYQLVKNIKKFELACENVEVAKISGAVGIFSYFPISIQDIVAKELNLKSVKNATQIVPRDNLAHYIFIIALISTCFENICVELRNLQRTEIQEITEFFDFKKQKGSSAMPHKCNPIGFENITGISRMIRGYVFPGLENIVLWHERDISHSSVERIILPDITTLFHYSIRRLNKLLQTLNINEDNIKNNIFLTNGLVFTQKIILLLIKKYNWQRLDAYDFIKKIANDCFLNKKDFVKEIHKQNLPITKKEFNEIFNINNYLKNIDKIYKNMGIN